MSRYKLQCDIWVPAPIDEVWSFMTSIKNLAVITPEIYHSTLIKGERVENGADFAMSISPYNLPIKLKWLGHFKDVVDTGDKRQFIDIQDKGPFSLWRHQHLFESGVAEVHGQRSNSQIKVHKPGTWIRDRVDYGLSMAKLGALANKYFVQRRLGEMFAYRTQKMREIFSH